MQVARSVLQPGFEAIVRYLSKRPVPIKHSRQPDKPTEKVSRKKSCDRPKRGVHRQESRTTQCVTSEETASEPRKKRGRRPRGVIEFPKPLWESWRDPSAFHEALELHMKRHGDTYWYLHRAVVKPDETLDRKTLITWVHGTRAPRSLESFKILGRIERRYRLPEGYFKAKLPDPSRSAHGHKPAGITPSERRRIAWHLPDDFDRRSASEQEEILEWVRRVIVAGSTDYRRYQSAAMKHRYAVRFPDILTNMATRASSIRQFGDVQHDLDFEFPDDMETEPATTTVVAPPRLRGEMADLLRFKTSTLTAFGYQRSGVWGEKTAAQKVEHLGLLFGALVASSRSAVRGLGVPLQSLTFGLLVFPSVWDWYLQWRERRRGFFTAWEVDMLRLAMALTRVETGWIRQTDELVESLRPIGRLVTAQDIDIARQDWDAACDRCHKHCGVRAKEVQRVARVHRDPFEAILPILETDSPVGEYKKIADEILYRMPDERRYPRAAAESVRSFLMIRLGLHLGTRQKNLRQLLFCQKGRLPLSERQLAELKRGELRWSERENGWEVLIPAAAFKNAHSSYFGDKPFRLILPDIGELYRYLDAYVDRHRACLLNGGADPGTFFVKTMKATSKTAEYDQNTFYEAWRLIIQRYGIYNPYTQRGAIAGLLPHGPHNVRDVLATHILKKTGSYEQASYAIQDTPETVANHYARFLPQDKAALAAQILNKVWDAA